MSPPVYVETSVVSYLAARPTSDLVTQARQRLTHEWWATRRQAFALVIAPPVLTEAAGGDPAASARRLGYLAGLPRLDVTAGPPKPPRSRAPWSASPGCRPGPPSLRCTSRSPRSTA